MYIYRNTEARSCNYCCRVKAIIITYAEYVYSRRYPACNAHAPYCLLWPAAIDNIFHHYLINGTIFGGGGGATGQKMYALISQHLLSEIFLILRRNESDMIKKNVLTFA